MHVAVVSDVRWMLNCNLNGTDGWWDKKGSFSNVCKSMCCLFEIICMVTKKKEIDSAWCESKKRDVCLCAYSRCCGNVCVWMQWLVAQLPPPLLGVESEPRAVLCSCVSTVEACSWIEAAVEVPPHGAKEHKEGKRKDGAEEGLSGEFKERATERGECT